MGTVILAGVILVVALVAASGVWVGTVLIAAVARIQRSAPSVKNDAGARAIEPPRHS